LQNIENLWKLYDERINLYRKYADIIIKNDDDMDVVTERIITALKGKL
jgi:shikimate kinase